MLPLLYQPLMLGFVFAGFFAAAPATAFGAACDRQVRPITVGGVTSFDTLADPAASARLRASGMVGLYMHATAVQAAHDDGQLVGILSTFRNTGPLTLEMGLQTTPRQVQSLLLHWIPAMTGGVAANEMNVNGLDAIVDAKQLAQWKYYVKVARSAGFKTISPVFSPNGGNETLHFADPVYDRMREAARYGGGLTTDAPPGYFLGRGAAYQQFTADEIVWANTHGLRSTAILSPWGNAFRQDAAAMLSILRRQRALPCNYVVENYNIKMSASSPVAIGYETGRDTVTGVALWLTTHVADKLPD